jgi:hypothetical protein
MRAKYYDYIQYWIVDCPLYGKIEIYYGSEYRIENKKCQTCEYSYVDCGNIDPKFFARTGEKKNSKILILIQEETISSSEK